MSDEFDIVHLDEEDVQAIIDWAVNTGAMVTLMHSAPIPETAEEFQQRFTGYTEGVELMFHSMPPALSNEAILLASDVLDETEHEEAEVARFREELEEL